MSHWDAGSFARPTPYSGLPGQGGGSGGHGSMAFGGLAKQRMVISFNIVSQLFLNCAYLI